MTVFFKNAVETIIIDSHKALAIKYQRSGI